VGVTGFAVCGRLSGRNFGRHRFSRFVGVKVGVAIFFLGQSIGIVENNTFQFFFWVNNRY